MANQDLKENVLLNLRSVTQSVKGGVPLERLQRDYKDLLGSPIPFRDLGYNSLEAFIRDIPDVITLKRNNEGQYMAMGVADASTAHIVSLVSRQKTETRKKPSKITSRFGFKKPWSSRYTFREGARGTHSSYTSPPPASSKSIKPKPSSKPPVTVQHSKPRASAEPVSTARKYEVAPRFLKLKEMQNSSSTASSSAIKSPTVPSSPSIPPSPTTIPPSPTARLSPPISSPTIPAPIAAPSAPVSRRPISSVPQKTFFNFDDTEVIPPPKAVPRSIPIKPQPLEITRSQQYDALKCARSAKEFIEIYAKMNNIQPAYRTMLFGQKAKSKGYVSTLILKDKKYQSYPDMRPTEELAEEEAATKAMIEIKERKEDLNILPETPYSNAEEIRILLNRIEEIVCEKPSGMFDNGIVREYEQNFNESLPSCWPQLLKQSICIEIEELKVEYGKKPKGVNFIVRPCKELSSGNQTPSSTSSKTEFLHGDLDSKCLKLSLVDLSLPKVPDIKIPTGNVWEVFITDVNDSLSARFVDYDDEFRALSEDMDQFYKSRSLPVTEVFERQIYAACTDDNPNIWHRVIIDEILEDGTVSCYFVDNGDISCVLRDNLQEMCPRFLQLPYQAIHLALDELEEYENCIRTDMLENYLLGQTLIAEVKRWYPISEFFPEHSGINRTVYYVVLFDTSDPSGDINLNDLLKKTAMESLVCRLPKLTTASRAYLSHVTPEGHLYLRLTNPQECWIELELDRLSPMFEEASATGSKIPLDTMCAAKYESGSWHRAIVSESLHACTDPELVEVFFVDYGHVGVVGKSEICELKPINELLASAPSQAICCEFANALPSPSSRWTERATEKLLQLAPFDQELLIRVVSEGDGTTLAKVNLCKRNEDSNIISINESLSCNPALFYEEPSSAPIKAPSVLPLRQNSRKNSIKSNLSGIIPDVAVPAEEQMAKRLGTSLSSEKIEWLTTPDNIKSPDAFEVHSPTSISLPFVPEKRELFDVFVTMTCHPHNFVVQPLDSCNELDKLMKEMESFYSMEENLLEMDFSMLRKNDYYAALHGDGRWYRARIEQIVNGSPVMVVVNFVDFGDFSTVAIARLQPLYQKFKVLPCQAIKASLAGIKPFDSDWDPVHCIKFNEMVTEKPFVSVIVNKRIEVKDDIPTLHVELNLIDTTDPSKDVYINEVLISKNYAKPSDK